MDDTAHQIENPNPKIRAGHIKWKIIRDTKIQRALDRLKHACECSNTHCTETDCDEMKSIVVHSKLCSKEPKKSCRSCRQLIALCLYHAKRSKECESNHCVIPHCAGIKYSLMVRKKKLRKILQVGCSQETGCGEHPMVVVDDEEVQDVAITHPIVIVPDPQPPESVTTSVTLPRQSIAELSTADPRLVTQRERLLEHMDFLLQMAKSFERDRQVLDILKAHPFILSDVVGRGQSPERDRILDILKAHPHIMAHMIRFRQSRLAMGHSPPTFSTTPNQAASSRTATMNTTINWGIIDTLFQKLLRAHSCEISVRLGEIPCSSIDCSVWGNIHRHVIQCADANCTVLHCVTSKFLLDHWAVCTGRECPPCRLRKWSLLQHSKFWETCTDMGCRFCTPMRVFVAENSTSTFF